MSTQTKNYIHLHIHVHHIIQLPETQDPNSSFTTAPGSAALFDGAVGESPPADLSPGGASAPHWLGRAAPRDLLLQAEKAFLRKMIWIHNLCRFSGHGLLLIMDLDLEISIPPVKAFGGMSRNLKHCCQVAGWISCHLRNRQDPPAAGQPGEIS